MNLITKLFKTEKKSLEPLKPEEMHMSTVIFTMRMFRNQNAEKRYAIELIHAYKLWNPTKVKTHTKK